MKDRIREDHETTLESLGDNTEIIWYSDTKEEGIYNGNKKFLLEFAYKFNSSIYYAIYTEKLFNQQFKDHEDIKDSDSDYDFDYEICNAIKECIHKTLFSRSVSRKDFEFASKCTKPVFLWKPNSLKQLTRKAILGNTDEGMMPYDHIPYLGISEELQNYLRESLPKPELIPGIYDLYNSCKFYWGNIDRKEAELILKDEPEGSFLLKIRTREIHEKNCSKNINDLGENTIILYFHIYKKTFDTFEINHSYRNFLLEFAYKPDDFSIDYAIITEDLYQRYVRQINTVDREFYRDDYDSDHSNHSDHSDHSGHSDHSDHSDHSNKWKKYRASIKIGIVDFIIKRLVNIGSNPDSFLGGGLYAPLKNAVVRTNVFSLKELSRAKIRSNTELTYEKISELAIPDELQSYLREFSFIFGTDLTIWE